VPEPEQPAEPASDVDRSIAELVLDVSEQTSILIREEIELARAEITEKVTKLIKGSVVGLVAGVFALLALILLMHGFAWLLNDLLFENNLWAGFLIEAALFLILGAAAGLFAYRSLQSGAPPTPEMAIEEAKEIKATFEGES
jgi:uncharacterized membrane protein YqjE